MIMRHAPWLSAALSVTCDSRLTWNALTHKHELTRTFDAGPECAELKHLPTPANYEMLREKEERPHLLVEGGEAGRQGK